jgi:hypothetical protein
MKQPGGFGPSFHQRVQQRQRQVAAAGEMLRRQAEAERGWRLQAEAGQGDGGFAVVRGGGGWDGGAPYGPGPATAQRGGQGVRQRRVCVVAGQARDVRFDKSPHWLVGSRQVHTLVFRLEHFDERADQAWIVPVEVQAAALDGFVRDGDAVEASGRFSKGVLHANRVVNHTNGSFVRSSGGRGLLQRVVTIVAMLAVLAIAAGIAAGLFFGWRPPGFEMSNSCPPPEFPVQPPGCP